MAARILAKDEEPVRARSSALPEGKMNVPSRARAALELKWINTSFSPLTISGQYIFPVPVHVYAGVGGFRELNKRHRQRQRLDK